MKEEITSKKKCENCRYYDRHYKIFSNTRYRATGCGNCLHEKMEKAYKRKPLAVCELWEDIALQKEERKKKINDVLIDMAKSLEQIAMILKNDENKEKS